MFTARFQAGLFDLSQTPNTLDRPDLDSRVQKYTAILREHIFLYTVFIKWWGLKTLSSRR